MEEEEEEEEGCQKNRGAVRWRRWWGMDGVDRAARQTGGVGGTIGKGITMMTHSRGASFHASDSHTLLALDPSSSLHYPCYCVWRSGREGSVDRGKKPIFLRSSYWVLLSGPRPILFANRGCSFSEEEEEEEDAIGDCCC